VIEDDRKEDSRAVRVCQHLGLVRAIAAQVRKQLSPSLDFEDLVGYGQQGLLEAVDRFDKRRGVAFSTFAYYRVRGAMYDGLRRMGHLPRAAYRRLRASERAHAYLEELSATEGAAQPGPRSLRDELGAMYRALAGATTVFVTALEDAGENGEPADEEAVPADETVAVGELCARVRRAVGVLPRRERRLIERHYFRGETLKDAGARIGLTKSGASRLHARVVDRLRGTLLETPPAATVQRPQRRRRRRPRARRRRG
jgi:RNA polymerase sigma factor FliA